MNRVKSPVKLWFSFSLLAAILVAAPGYAQNKTVVRSSTGSLLDALPSDCALVIRVPSTSELIGKLKSSPLGAILEKPDVKSVVDELKGKVEEFRKEGKKEVGFDPVSLLSSIKGEMVIAYGSLSPLQRALTDQLTGVEPKVSSEDLALFVSFEVGAGNADVAAFKKEMFATVKKEGGKVKSAPFHGGTMTTLSPPEGEDEIEGIYVVEHGPRLMLGLSKGFIEQVASNLAAPGDSVLTKDRDFRATYKLAGRGSDAFFFVNTKSVANSLGGALNATFFGFFWQKFQSLVLGASLNNIGMSVGVNGTEIVQNVFVNNNGSRDGIVGWIDGPPMTPAPAGFIPGNVASAGALALDIGKVFDFFKEIGQTALSFQGGGNVDQMFEKQVGVKFADLRRAFGARIDFFATKVGSVDQPAGDATFVLNVKDSAPIKKLIGKIQEMASGALTAADYQGHSVFTVPDLEEVPLGFTVTDSAMILSLDSENVKKTIRRLKEAASPLASDPGFLAAAKTAPSKVHMFSYQTEEYGRQMGAVYDQLVEQMIFGMQEAGADDLPKGTDKALRTIFTELSKVFGNGVGWGEWQEKGFFMKGSVPFKK